MKYDENAKSILHASYITVSVTIIHHHLNRHLCVILVADG